MTRIQLVLLRTNLRPVNREGDPFVSKACCQFCYELMPILTQKISGEFQRWLLIGRPTFVRPRGSSDFGSPGVIRAPLHFSNRSLRSCECNVSQRHRNQSQGSSPRRCFVPQNERSLKRHKRSCVPRNEAWRVVSSRATRRNRSTVGKGTCRSGSAFATIHSEHDCALIFLRLRIEFHTHRIRIDIVKKNL